MPGYHFGMNDKIMQHTLNLCALTLSSHSQILLMANISNCIKCTPIVSELRHCSGHKPNTVHSKQCFFVWYKQL